MKRSAFFLCSKDTVQFRDIREVTGLSNGYLWSHIRALEVDDLMSINKEVNGRKVKTTYTITDKGRREFEDFRKTMIELLR
ncbi:MAG: transcriptional regulator [Candidatus Nitrosopolaris sp.]